MKIRCLEVIVIVLYCVFGGFLLDSLYADEIKLYYLGASSAAEGYTTQLNNQGAESYIKFASVAPIVNRMRIVNSANGNVMFDGRPEVGSTVYLPVGMYSITGWSSYGTEDIHAVAINFQQTFENVSKPLSPEKTQPLTVDGNPLQPSLNTTTIYSYPGGYYYYPNYYPAPCPPQNCQLIWCTYCSKYHSPYGCVYTMPRRSVTDPYNHYWRGNK